MALIRCTQKLLAELKRYPVEEMDHLGRLGGWHANLLRIDRRKCVLFTNDKTLFSFLVPGMKKAEFENFFEVFRLHLFQALMREGLTQREIEVFLEESRELGIGKTNNRSVLGSMNDFAFEVESSVFRAGGLAYTDMADLNHGLCHNPMKAIGYKYSTDIIRETLGDTGT